MYIDKTLSDLRVHIDTSFQALDTWLHAPPSLLFQHQEQGWNAAQILEHVILTNHFLLILIEKGARKASELRHKHDIHAAWQDYQCLRPDLMQVGSRHTFQWIRPEHMEPQPVPDLAAVRARLHMQRDQCFQVLDALSDGAGVLFKTTMTVNDLGKLDVYQYLYFLSLHIRRHIQQLEAC